MKTSWLPVPELLGMGFQFSRPRAMTGDAAPKISRFARFYNPQNIYLGPHVRIDDFCILSAGEFARIDLCGHNHISAGACLYGGSGIHVGEHVQISAQSLLFSESDMAEGEHLIGPTYPAEFRAVNRARIVLNDFSMVYARCTLLPGACLARGAVLGAGSLLLGFGIVPQWQIWAGAPARYLKARKEGIVDLAGRLEC